LKEERTGTSISIKTKDTAQYAKQVEDENHFILECKRFEQIRLKFYDKVSKTLNFKNVNSINIIRSLPHVVFISWKNLNFWNSWISAFCNCKY
jgi:hypothetical protein